MITKTFIAAASLAVATSAFAENLQDNDATRAIVAEMMADAESRSSHLQSAQSGHDGKFFLSSNDGNFRLNVSGQIQFRYMANFLDGDGEHNEQGFTNRRTKLGFSGNIYNDFNYKIVGAFDRKSGDFSLEDAYVNRRIWDDGVVQFGQFKLPFMLEENTSSSRQLAVDRSAVNEVFNQGRSQAIQLSQDWDNLRAYVAFSDGFSSANTDFVGDPAEWGATLRVDYLLAGDRGQFKGFSSAPGSEFAALLGGAFHYEEGDTVGADMYSYTADLSFQGDGWNAMFAGVGRNVDMGNGTEYDDFGLVAQAGMFIGETDWEPFVRYDGVFADSDRGYSTDNFNFVTLGANYYMHGHAAKFTADVVYAMEETYDLGDMTSTSGIGLLGSMEEGEVALRFQFQLLF